MDIITAQGTQLKGVEIISQTAPTGTAPPTEENKRENRDSLELSEDYLKYRDENENGIPDSEEITADEDEEEETSPPAPEETEEPDKTPGEDKNEQSGKTTVSVNVEKRQRQIAAAQTADEINIVLRLLANDLSECKEGLKNGWCDESEVAKAEALISQAKGRMAEVAGNSEDEQKGLDAFSMSMLM